MAGLRRHNLGRSTWAALAVLLPLTGCGMVDAASEGRSYQVSSSPNEEILFLAIQGGSGPFAPQYRLYGDGRLIREIVEKRTDEPRMSHEAQLLPEDIALLFQLAVDSGLPELDAASVRERIGRDPLTMSDGATVVLEMHFETYQKQGQSSETPFESRISMHAPKLQARHFPQLGEAQALVTLQEALDDYFSQSAAEVLYGKGRPSQ